MSEVDQDSKTELPTEKRLQESFEKGQFAKSPELQVVAILLAALGVIGLTASAGARDLASLSVNIWGELATLHLETGVVPVELGACVKVLAQVLMPLMGSVIIAILLIGGFQSGFRLSPESVGWHLDRLDFTKGFGRIFSKQVLVKGAVDMMKLVSVALVLWMGAHSLINDPIFSTTVEAAYLGDFLRRATVEFISKMTLALGTIAAISYSYEKYRTQQDLMMTKQEIKDEHKQAEGDGQTKMAMRRMARRLMQKQMLAAVPTADVIVTNPTHYAVALKYERGRDGAPVLLAKGENQFARRIKALAAEHNVPVVENKPVARVLYAMGKVGETIPAELYQAVAGILAFVYRTHRLYFHELKMRRSAAEADARRTG